MINQRTYDLAARRQKPTFIHFALTVLTCGLWLPVRVMACAENGRIRKAQAEIAMRRDYSPPHNAASGSDDYQYGPEYVARARQAGWTG